MNPFHEAKIVSKPWGQETWIADGRLGPYALKRILFKAGFRSSLQVHEYKSETNYVLSGSGKFQFLAEPFDCRRFVDGGYSQDEILGIVDSLVEYKINEGDIINVQPGQIHRVIAETDLTFIEASSPELDDVIRIQDDAQRGHGKIDSEHTS